MRTIYSKQAARFIVTLNKIERLLMVSIRMPRKEPSKYISSHIKTRATPFLKYLDVSSVQKKFRMIKIDLSASNAKKAAITHACKLNSNVPDADIIFPHKNLTRKQVTNN